jgi:hypothetical protein
MTISCRSRAISDPPGSTSICGPLGRLLLALALCLAAPATAPALAPGMHGPQQPLEGPPAAAQTLPPPQAARQLLMTPIRWFQRYVSPMDGPRCRFAPTCSSFGYAAVRDHGVWHGTLMTADRLLRCSYLTDSRDYPHRPDGRLADPVAGNLLEE